MEKEQGRLKVLNEIRKDRVGNYPYFIVATTYASQDHHFIVAADYRGETAEISLYPFKNDMSRLATSTLALTDILPRKLIATIHVVSINFRPNSASVTILQAEFILGYRTGHLILVEYKDRDCRVKQRFNRSLKGEGFFSRASSAIFGGEDTYNPYFKVPIRSFSLHPLTPDYYHICHMGNSIMLQQQLNQQKENKFLSKHETIDLDNFHINYDINKVIKEGDYFLYGCDYYTYFGHPQSKTFFLSFREEINSYANIPTRKELVVSLTSKEEVLLLDHQHFTLKAVIRLQIPLRNLGAFSHEGQECLVLMPYENHIVLYNLNNNTYCKMRGHRSYIAGVHYSPKDSRIITAGMDHCICFMKVGEIQQQSWIRAEKGAEANWSIREFGIPQQKFANVYRIGQYGANRSNQSSYGYASIFELNGNYCFATYDSRIIIYAPF